MATTTPDNIQYPVNSDQVAPLASHFKNLADSTQAALNTKVDDTDARLSDERTPLDGSVTTDKLAPNSVTSAKIVDGTITNQDIKDDTIESVKLAPQDYIKFDTTYSGGSTQPGMVAWNDVDGTLEFQLKGGNVTLQIGQEQVVRVKNNTGSTLDNGKAVYISGSDGTNLRVAYANAGAENTSAGTIGVLTEDLNNGNAGYVTTFGLVRSINTSALTEGAPVWLSTTNGVLTSTRPTAPNHSVMVGFCLKSHAVNGVIFVRVDNGWELDELHNVLITTPSNGQALVYDSALGVWKNATPVNSLSGLSDVSLSSPATNEVLKYNGSAWVNGTAAGGVTAAATAPTLSTAKSGDAWFDTNDGTLYVCYVDTDSTKQWVQVQANSALEATILGRLSSLEGQAIAYGNQTPNYLINGAFDIWQRGTTGFTNNNYCADRWKASISNTTISRTTMPVGSPATYGITFTTSSATNTNGIIQALESIHADALRGKTVTLSFYAQTSVTGQTLLADIQTSATADTSSTGFSVLKRETLTTSTTLTRYSTSVAIPADSTSAGIRVVILSSNMPSSSTLTVTGVQLEVGSVATVFRRNAPNIQAELAACQRYYWRYVQPDVYAALALGVGYTTGTEWVQFELPVVMRTTPTISIDALSSAYWLGNGGNNSGAYNMTNRSTKHTFAFSCDISGAVANVPYVFRPYSYLEASAEL